MVMKEQGHRQIDLLKLDIEGAEYDLIPYILEMELNIRFLCIEFHKVGDDPDQNKRIRKYCRKLVMRGYSLVAVETKDNTYTFLSA